MQGVPQKGGGATVRVKKAPGENFGGDNFPRMWNQATPVALRLIQRNAGEPIPSSRVGRQGVEPNLPIYGNYRVRPPCNTLAP
jgi:hypothetical protein